jgi:anti-sigma B factor antagonist
MMNVEEPLPLRSTGSWRTELSGIVSTSGPAPDGDGFVVVLEGDLDLASAGEVRRRLLQLLTLPINRVVVDLGELTFMDSSGLAALCATRQAAVEQGTELVLHDLPPQARRVMELTDTLALFVLTGGDEPPAD